MKWLCTLTLSMFYLSANSQNERYAVKLCPLALIDEVTFPTIQGGFEFRLSDRISWYSEVGVKYREGYYETADTSHVNSSGLKAKTELRYYFPGFFKIGNMVNTMQGFYTGVNLFFVHDAHNSEIEFHPENETSLIVVDNFGVNKNLYGANLILGWQHRVLKKFMADIYGGLGVRLRTIDNVYREYDASKDTLVDSGADITLVDIRDNTDLQEGSSTIANFTFGIRIGYLF